MTKAICRAYAVAVIAAKLPWLTIDGAKGGRAMQISSAFQLKYQRAASFIRPQISHRGGQNHFLPNFAVVNV